MATAGGWAMSEKLKSESEVAKANKQAIQQIAAILAKLEDNTVSDNSSDSDAISDQLSFEANKPQIKMPQRHSFSQVEML